MSRIRKKISNKSKEAETKYRLFYFQFGFDEKIWCFLVNNYQPSDCSRFGLDVISSCAIGHTSCLGDV